MTEEAAGERSGDGSRGGSGDDDVRSGGSDDRDSGSAGDAPAATSDTRRAVLAALAEGASGPELAERLDISRAAVWNHVEALREAGFTVESGPGGYRVTGAPEYGGLAVEHGLDAPFTVEYHESVGSTNDRARELAAAGAADVAVLADEQTGGRGRLDRPWESPPGGVWLSLVLRPAMAPADATLLTLAAAVAVARAAREAGVDARIKWPNDVVVPADESDGGTATAADDATDNGPADDDPAARRGGRKLAGVLTEVDGEAGRVDWVIVGIGVNADLDPDALPAGATSLRAEAGDVDRRAFVQRLLETFDDLRDDTDRILDAWREHAVTLGQRVRVDTPGGSVEGEATDVTDTGALVVDTGDEREVVHAGDCDHLRA